VNLVALAHGRASANGNANANATSNTNAHGPRTLVNQVRAVFISIRILSVSLSSCVALAQQRKEPVWEQPDPSATDFIPRKMTRINGKTSPLDRTAGAGVEEEDEQEDVFGHRMQGQDEE
jgi:hypothetical protein